MFPLIYIQVVDSCKAFALAGQSQGRIAFSITTPSPWLFNWNLSLRQFFQGFIVVAGERE
jgi:hypothetical protein